MTDEKLAKAQGVYFLASGLWPLVHMRSFLAVTGPKKDLWLVGTVGALVSCIGLQLLTAPKRSRPVALSAALGLAGIDLVHVAKGTISPVYLADAAVEIALAVLWSGGLLRTSTESERVPAA